jgi:uncharacterized protein YjbJ (UPF0337 family)
MGRRKSCEEATMDEAKGKAKKAWGAATGDEDKKAEVPGVTEEERGRKGGHAEKEGPSGRGRSPRG